MIIKPRKNFVYGTIDSIEDFSIPASAARNSLNWVTEGTKIALRRGYARLGLTENTGAGKITGLGVGVKVDGTEIPFRTRGRKIEYYDSATDDWIEIGSNQLPAAANGEHISIETYLSLAGAQVWLNSPNSGLLKIMTANPGDITNMDRSAKNFKGYIKIKQGRMFLWNRGGTIKDKTGLYGSYIDKDEASDFTKVTAEDLGTGDGADDTFAGTLAFKASDSRRTCFGVLIAGATTALKTISNIVVATGVVTATGHGLSVGDYVVFQDIVGTVELNKRIGQVLTVPTSDTFTVDIDTTGFTAYTSDGKVGKAELLVDDQNGALASSDGGTGTINYTTGAFTTDFNTAPVNLAEVVTEYYWEDSSTNGIADFTKSATRTAGQGFVFRQDDGGTPFQGIATIGSVEYCFHSAKAWALTLTENDTAAKNLLYRDRVGIPFFRAFFQTGDGIYYVDDTDENDPHFRLLTLDVISSTVVPRSISKRLKLNNNLVGVNLADYRFDKAAVIEFGGLIVVACRHKSSTSNNTVFTYNKKSGAIDRHDYYASCFAIYNGTLIAGDSVTNNVYTLFSGHDDDGVEQTNYWESKLDDLEMERLKVSRKLLLRGQIGPDQKIKVSASIDGGAFVEVLSDEDVANGTHFIEGSGSYVDNSQSVLIGSLTLGRGEVGGGGGGIEAYNYEREVKMEFDKFQEIVIRFEALALGYASVSEYQFKDVREKWKHIPTKYQMA